MVHAEPFELRAHAFEHPIDRAFGAGGQLTDLYSPKTLQAELDYLSLGVLNPANTCWTVSARMAASSGVGSRAIASQLALESSLFAR